MNKKVYLPEISEEDLFIHIEDDDFFEVFGNPVLFRSNDEAHDCVLMSIKYYNRQQELLAQARAWLADESANDYGK